jgi:hypothetical protein
MDNFRKHGVEDESDRVAYYILHGLPDVAAMKFTNHWDRNHECGSNKQA